MWRKASVSGLVGLSLLLGAAGYSAAELSYPKETVKLVSPFAAGGGNDYSARLATKYVASAKSDGNTLLVTTNATIVINSQMFSSVERGAEQGRPRKE
jgi:tripartite-type tricarboxylate transporter receptor subunit TctC